MSDVLDQMKARRAASRRLPVLESGRSDPWHYDPPSDGYREAAAHLLSHGLTPAPDIAALREMYKGGENGLRAAKLISERWALNT